MDYYKFSEDELIRLLKEVYVEGCFGYVDLAEDSVDKFFEKCLGNKLNYSSESVVGTTEPQYWARTPDDVRQYVSGTGSYVVGTDHAITSSGHTVLIDRTTSSAGVILSSTGTSSGYVTNLFGEIE